MGRGTRRVLTVVGVVLVAGAVAWLERGTSTAPTEGSTALPAAATPGGGAGALQLVVSGVTVKSHGRPVLRGDVDLTDTVERIRAGRRHPHRNDGGVFQNRERRLPQRQSGHYREYVHPTPGLDGPGPQRLVVGADGEWYYTPDHYATFIRLDSGRSP